MVGIGSSFSQFSLKGLYVLCVKEHLDYWIKNKMLFVVFFIGFGARFSKWENCLSWFLYFFILVWIYKTRQNKLDNIGISIVWNSPGTPNLMLSWGSFHFQVLNQKSFSSLLVLWRELSSSCSISYIFVRKNTKECKKCFPKLKENCLEKIYGVISVLHMLLLPIALFLYGDSLISLKEFENYLSKTSKCCLLNLHPNCFLKWTCHTSCNLRHLNTSLFFL